MRLFDIEALSVETAGQSSAGSLVNLAGIKDGRAFRDAVLKQRDLVVGSVEEKPLTTAVPSVANDAETIQILKEIRDTLKSIERQA